MMRREERRTAAAVCATVHGCAQLQLPSVTGYAVAVHRRAHSVSRVLTAKALSAFVFSVKRALCTPKPEFT